MKGRPLIGATLASSLLLSIPFIAEYEGKRNDPYKDIVGVTTVCYGETKVKMRRYSDAECTQMLRKSVESYAQPVLQMTPTLDGKPKATAAVTSMAYNIGIENYRKSTTRSRFLRGDIKGGCEAIKLWNQGRINGKLQPIRGLTRRREAEYRLCIQDASK